MSRRRRCRPVTAARRSIGWRRRRLADRRTPARSKRLAPAATCCTPPRWCADPTAKPTGVVVATDYLTGDLAARSRRMTQAFESYNQLRVLKRPLTGLYLSFFLMVTLLILFGATWMGSYLAKRITRPVLMLSAAAREIGAGRLDQRVEPQSNDEFGSLVEAFNAMAERAGDEPAESRSRRRSISNASTSRSRPAPLHRDDSRAHHDRRGVGRCRGRDYDDQQRGGAAARPASARSSASRRSRCSIAPTCSRCARCSPVPARRRRSRRRRKSRWPRDGQELHLAAVATALVGETGVPEGVVLVLDDVTPLIRAQKVAAWREVARRLAHEIKNPLTPIQLSRRAAAPALRRTRRRRPRRWSTNARPRSSARWSRSKGWSTSSRSLRGCRRRARCRPTWRS